VNIDIHLIQSPVKAIFQLYRMKSLVRLHSVLVVFILFMQQGHSQNIYDYEHSKKYSQYLFDSKQYKLASEELERVLYYNNESDSVKYQLIRAYLLGNEYTMVTRRMDSLFPIQANIPRSYALEYSKALLSLNSINEARKFVESSRFLTENDKLYLNLNVELLGYEWDKAQKTYSAININKVPLDARYKEVFSRINSVEYKSPGLALALSAVVPGTGKAYAHNWKDGLFSFIFVGGSTFQAIRGYHKYGAKSGFFITYASLATTFYLANLYGSFTAAKKYNAKLKKQIHSEIRSVFNDTL